MTILALSPHLDDVAFSCGGTIAQLRKAGIPVVVATLFTGSVASPRGFALACQTTKGIDRGVDYMALRRAEDQAAMAALGVDDYVHAPCVEAPHRGYDSATALFDGVRRGDDGDGVVDVVGQLLAQVQPDLVLSPATLGQHVDHILTDAAVRVLCPPHRVLRYLDTPYVLRASKAELAAVAGDRAIGLVDVGAGLRAKLDACAAYASQLPFQFGGETRMRRTLATAPPWRGALSRGSEGWIGHAPALLELTNLATLRGREPYVSFHALSCHARLPEMLSSDVFFDQN